MALVRILASAGAPRADVMRLHSVCVANQVFACADLWCVPCAMHCVLTACIDLHYFFGIVLHMYQET
jgi:hypothetical protein